MINPDLKPWNIFNNIDYPRLGISGNVLLDNKEWYNSYMPPFFELCDVEFVTKIKRQIDNCNADLELFFNTKIYHDYLTKFEKYSDEVGSKIIVRSIKNRINNYFNIVESKLFEIYPENDEVNSLLGFVLAGLNLMQEFMDPVEAVTTLKSSNVMVTLGDKFKNIGEIDISSKVPSSELAYIPMVVLLESGCKTDSLKDVVRYYVDLFEVDMDTLLESSNYSNRCNEYTKYMSINFAKKIIDSTAKKIPNVDFLTQDEMLAYDLQKGNGIMTWSKYILLKNSKCKRRYDSTNSILFDVKEIPFIKKNTSVISKLIPQTVSGSEKQALLIYLLSAIRNENVELFSSIKDKAEDYYYFSKT